MSRSSDLEEAQSLRTPPDRLKELTSCGDTVVEFFAATNPNLPQHRLRSLMEVGSRAAWANPASFMVHLENPVSPNGLAQALLQRSPLPLTYQHVVVQHLRLFWKSRREALRLLNILAQVSTESVLVWRRNCFAAARACQPALNALEATVWEQTELVETRAFLVARRVYAQEPSLCAWLRDVIRSIQYMEVDSFTPELPALRLSWFGLEDDPTPIDVALYNATKAQE